MTTLTKAQLEGEVAALKARSSADEIEQTLAAYFDDGKLCPFEREAAHTLAQHDLAALRVILDARQSVFGLQSERLGLTGKDGKEHANVRRLTAADLRACELTGRKPEEFAMLKAQFFNESLEAQEN